MTDSSRLPDERTMLIELIANAIAPSWDNDATRHVVLGEADAVLDALKAAGYRLSSDRAQAPLPEELEKALQVVSAAYAECGDPCRVRNVASGCSCAAIDTVSSALRAQAERIAEIEEGLRPFAEFASSYDLWADADLTGIAVSAGDLRRARALLSSSGTAASGSQEQTNGPNTNNRSAMDRGGDSACDPLDQRTVAEVTPPLQSVAGVAQPVAWRIVFPDGHAVCGNTREYVDGYYMANPGSRIEPLYSARRLRRSGANRRQCHRCD